MQQRLLTIITTVLIATFVPAAASSAAPPEQRISDAVCVVHVAGQRASGEMTLSEPRCYATHADAMNREGVGAWGEGASETAPVQALAAFELGYHCDGYNLVGPCTSVVGNNCSGGWLNTSAAWRNRISSTLSGCPNILHWDLPNLGGAVAVTYGAGPHNLTTFNNRTESLQYS